MSRILQQHVTVLHTCVLLDGMQAHPMYKGTDIYNTCLHRVLLRVNNTGPPGAVLYDLPLGWWDHDSAGCFDSRKSINDSQWRKGLAASWQCTTGAGMKPLQCERW
jgi:hypothetical protein